MTTTQTNTDEMFIDVMMDRYSPIDDCWLPGSSMAAQTADYFSRKGWEGIIWKNLEGDLIFFTTNYDDIRIMVTTTTGCIKSEARFDMTPIGVAMFAAATDAASAMI